MRKIVDMYCYKCNTPLSAFIESDTRKVKCRQEGCDGTSHKVITVPMFLQNASSGSVNSVPNKDFDKQGIKQLPIRSYPDETDLPNE